MRDADGGWRRFRWKLIKRPGRKLIKRINRLLARSSRVPTGPVFDPALFPFLRPLEEHWLKIRGEAEPLLGLREELPRVFDLQRDNYRISADGNWRTFILKGCGYRCERSMRICPETTRLVEAVPRLESAYFSILAPGARIPPHRGLSRGLIRVHLPLVVPHRAEACRMWIGGTPHVWREGRLLVFDDTFKHEVRNETDEERVVLLIDFERPMGALARLVHRVLLFAVRHTRFVQDARRKHAAWEERFLPRLDASIGSSR
jgi:beta-hydroxylase